MDVLNWVRASSNSFTRPTHLNRQMNQMPVPRAVERGSRLNVGVDLLAASGLSVGIHPGSSLVSRSSDERKPSYCCSFSISTTDMLVREVVVSLIPKSGITSDR